MCCDRNMINRRNVKKDVSGAVIPCRRLFTLEVEARIVAATLHLLEMTKMNDPEPTISACILPTDPTIEDKEIYLNKVSALVVNQFIVQQKRNADVQKAAKKIQREHQTDVYGRYPCRYRGCSKSFANPGKLKKDHEIKHDPPILEEPHDVHILKLSSTHEDDDMQCYQRSLLDYGILVLNSFMPFLKEMESE